MHFSKELQYKIRVSHIHIVERLSENVSENLCRQHDDFANYPFEPVVYLSICKDVFNKIGFDPSYVRQLVFEIVCKAYDLYQTYVSTGFRAQHFASGIHPEILISKHAEDLITLLKMMNEIYQKDQTKKLKNQEIHVIVNTFES